MDAYQTPVRQTWRRAITMYIRSDEERALLRKLLVVMAAYLPVNLVDDAVFPGLGLLDDPFAPINMIAAIIVVWRIGMIRFGKSGHM